MFPRSSPGTSSEDFGEAAGGKDVQAGDRQRIEII